MEDVCVDVKGRMFCLRPKENCKRKILFVLFELCDVRIGANRRSIPSQDLCVWFMRIHHFSANNALIRGTENGGDMSWTDPKERDESSSTRSLSSNR